MVEYLDKMDKEVIKLCDAINLFSPDIYTIESCCGHGKERFYIYFQAKNWDTLSKLLYFFDPCHNGFCLTPEERGVDRSHHMWQIEVTTDCAMSYPTLSLSGGIGEEAYLQADTIANMIIDHFVEEKE